MILALVRFATLRPGIVLALALAVVGAGVTALKRASLDVFPEFSPVQVVIQTEAPGLSAEQTELLVTKPIEATVSGVSGVHSLRSQSIPGLSVVTLVFRDGSNVYRNRQLVAERMTALSALLPQSIVPTITPLTSSASTILGIGLTSDVLDLKSLRSFTETTLRSQILSADGVADVNVFGGEVRQWKILVDPDKLAAKKLTLRDVVLAARNMGRTESSGFIENANQRLMIELSGQPESIGDLADRVVLERPDGPIRFKDIADIEEGVAPQISEASINGHPGVFLMVQGQLGANTRAVTRSTEAALEDLKPLLQQEKITMDAQMFRPANFIDVAITNVQRDMVLGSILVISVLFVFLFNVRTALISATAIPLSLLSAILILQLFSIPLNIMVLGGLAIALGEVVDDAIIDTENIFRRLRENRQLQTPLPVAAVVFNASIEVRHSVVYATFIVALVFVPLLTLSGVAGKLFAPLGLAYILAILSSLVVAVTVTPALTYLLLGHAKLSASDPPLIAKIRPLYIALLTAIDQRPKKILVAVFLFLALGLSILPFFEGAFIPPLKEGHFIVHLTLVPGSSAQETLRVGNRLSAQIRQIPGVRSVAQWVGRAPNGADTAGVHYSEFEVELQPLDGSAQTLVLDKIRALIGGDGRPGVFPGGNFAVNTFLTERIEETVAGYAAALVVNIHGPDLDALDQDARKVASVLVSVPGIEDVQLQAPPGFPEFTLRFKPDRLDAYGLTVGEVMDTLNMAIKGETTGEVRLSQSTVPVVVQAKKSTWQSLDALGRLLITAQDGRQVRVSEVASLKEHGGRYKILHLAGKRVQTVTANIVGRDIESVTEAVRQKIKKTLVLAPGDYVAFSGEAEEEQASRRDLILESLLCCFGILILLYMAFGELRPLVITLLNLPFALIGGVIAVLVTGGWLSLGSLVGFVTLFGITLRNAIMLISHYRTLVQVEGRAWSAETARIGAAERLPSILMTAIVTALGLLPLALGSGEPGREIEGPMASIIVGGLVTSTLLNLLVLPTVLLHFGRFDRQKKDEVTP